MWIRSVWFAFCVALVATPAYAQDPPPIHIEGSAPEGPDNFFFLEFEVPEGIVEIEVRHTNLTPGNSLDWGLDDPNGFRGWGGGKGQPGLVGLEAALPSYIPGPIPAGTWEVVVGKARIVNTPAEYAVDIFLRTEPTLEPQPRSPYEDPGVLDTEARWYAGDFHVHTHESDTWPTIRETLEFAESVGLDFVMLSEHNTNSGLTLYGSLQPDFPELLIVPGVEWTTYAGHANAIGALEWVDFKVGVRGVTVEGAVEAYQDQGALFSIDHPAVPGDNFCIGCPWEYEVDPTTIDGLEVQGGIWDAISYWEEMCAAGSHATALGGSDDHAAGQGSGVLYSPIGMPTTMVFADELSVEAIMEGVRSGRVVVKVDSPDAPMLETALSGERMGHTVFADTAILSVVVTDGAGTTLRVIKNGAVLERVSVDSDPFTHETNVQAPAEGEDRYRHQLMRGIDPQTIGSYVWLRAEGEAPDAGVPDAGSPDGGTDPGENSSGCSCRIASASDYDTGLLLMVLAVGVWYRRIRRS
ncbi:MAG: CehA/McbA family metallohydrolase [Deltaproteobacteria bacterium]|nr:CehA/McbA family metallohydrolase [Deltaproteobacteria bacterium]